MAFPWAFPGIAHFFCLFGGSLSIPGFSAPFANTMGASFCKVKHFKMNIKLFSLKLCKITYLYKAGSHC